MLSTVFVVLLTPADLWCRCLQACIISMIHVIWYVRVSFWINNSVVIYNQFYKRHEPLRWPNTVFDTCVLFVTFCNPCVHAGSHQQETVQKLWLRWNRGWSSCHYVLPQVWNWEKEHLRYPNWDIPLPRTLEIPGNIYIYYAMSGLGSYWCTIEDSLNHTKRKRVSVNLKSTKKDPKSLHFCHCLSHYSGDHYHFKQYYIHGYYVDLVRFVPILLDCTNCLVLYSFCTRSV